MNGFDKMKRLKEQSLELRYLATSYEERYFKDLRFELKELKNRFLKHQVEIEGEWETFQGDIRGDMGVDIGEHMFFYEKMPHGAGQCDGKKKEITINSGIVTDKKEIKNVLLHEMIHAYEYLLPITYQQYLVLFLYQKLAKRLGKRKFDRLISVDQHSVIVVHSLLFFLKSLTIDLARGLTLGTILGYGREEYLSDSQQDIQKKGGD